MPPSIRPAPTSMCNSSMKTMMRPAAAWISAQHGLQPLLELAAELGAGQDQRQVERQHAAVLQPLGHVAGGEPLRQALDDGGLADAGFADQHRIVLGAPRQHLDRAADLVVAADHRVELALARLLGQVAGVFLQRLPILLGGGRVGLAALAHLLDRLAEAAGLTPARVNRPRSGPCAARLASRRSAVTKRSPAARADSLAPCSTAASSGDM